MTLGLNREGIRQKYTYQKRLINRSSKVGVDYAARIYIFIELEVVAPIFSQLANMSLSSPQNFSSRFQLCFDFAMHYGSLYCPFKTFLLQNFLSGHKSFRSSHTFFLISFQKLAHVP